MLWYHPRQENSSLNTNKRVIQNKFSFFRYNMLLTWGNSNNLRKGKTGVINAVKLPPRDQKVSTYSNDGILKTEGGGCNISFTLGQLAMHPQAAKYYILWLQLRETKPKKYYSFSSLFIFNKLTNHHRANNVNTQQCQLVVQRRRRKRKGSYRQHK